MGGSDESSNLVEVSVVQHAMWHFANWQLWGNKEDYLAWKGLTGFQGKEEIIEQLIETGRQKGRQAAKKATRDLINNGLHPFQNPSVREKALISSLKSQEQLVKEGKHSFQNIEMRIRRARLDSIRKKKEYKEGLSPLQNPDTVEKRRLTSSKAKSSQNSTKVMCPHCKKVGGHTNMKRYHFDNCKLSGKNSDNTSPDHVR